MKNKILILISLLIITGCATSNNSNKTRYYVSVDGITNPDTNKGSTFVIAPLNEGIDKSDLQFREYAKYISRAMSAQGFVEQDDPLDCDIIVLLAYGISDPEEKEITYNRPIYGQTGISSKQTTANVYGTGTGSGLGSGAVANAIRGGNYTSKTTYTPTYGITGYVPETYTLVTFHRYIYLYAQDWRQDVEEGKRLRWKLHIDSEGSSGDLRTVFPIMVAGAQSYIGQNTQGNVEFTVFEDDPRINVIKGLAQPENTTVK